MTLSFLRSFVVGFHHENERPNTEARIVETMSQFGWKQLPHPPYNLELAPTNSHLTGFLKEFQYGTKFSSEDKVKNTVCK